jgi:precorrin-6B methylase 2
MAKYDELTHADASRRRNAAIRLGRTQDAAAIPALTAALESELDGDVRTSLVLALGAIKGEGTEALLRSIQPKGAREAEALSVAIDRVAAPLVKVEWAPHLTLPNMMFEVPENLENPIKRMFLKDGWPAVETERDGLMRCLSPIALDGLSPLPRWVYRMRLLMAEAGRSDSVEASLNELLAQVVAERRWRNWLVVPQGDAIPYRFSVEGRNVSKESLKSALQKIRVSLAPLGLVDRPTGYSVELVLSFLDSGARLYLIPNFTSDNRFRYRLKDVGASINPVVAAALVRLIPMRTIGTIIDPTCGSGTLLVERGFVDDDCHLVGIDVSSTACKAARENIDAARLSHRTTILCGDALDSKNWRPCGLVLANLPFGNRIRHDVVQLRELYRGILERSAEHLSAEGRVLFYTANRGLLEQSIAAAATFRTLARYRVQSGGLHVHIAVLGRSSATKPRKSRGGSRKR